MSRRYSASGLRTGASGPAKSRSVGSDRTAWNVRPLSSERSTWLIPAKYSVLVFGDPARSGSITIRPDDGGMQALKTLTEHSAGESVCP